MKVVLIGGHLSPALAVIDSLPKDTKILFIGRKFALEGDKAYSLEYQTISSLEIPFASINAGRFQRRLTKYTLPSLLKLPIGFTQSVFILNSFKPDVVVGFGSYVSLPVIFAAFLLKIPVVIHEQILGAGMANRIASLFAQKICISWDSSRKFFPKSKTVLTGLPVKRLKSQFHNATLPPNFQEKLPLIYITGGSLGSHFINSIIEGCLKNILEKFNVIHQTGDAKEYKDFDRLSNLKENLTEYLKKRYILAKFINPSDTEAIFRKADLVISRCGINTITELIYYKKPSLLIPLPFSGGSEQVHNAMFLEKNGAAEVFLQKDLTPDKFLNKINEMFGNISKYKHGMSKLEGVVSVDAAQRIIEVIKDAQKKR